MAPESGDSINQSTESDRDAKFAALADAQRRRLLEYLLEEYPAAVPRTAAVAHVASTTAEDYGRVETRMVHQHLPTLEAAGLVAHDAEAERLSYTGGEFVENVLDLL